MTDRERLQDVMRGLAIADSEGHESITIRRDDLRVLCKALRIASVMDGTAILYALDNPTLSRDVAERRAGAPGCGWCGHARTPSNKHLHAECDAILQGGRAS